MNVLSLFDGMSCGQQALERIGIKVDNYYASEIDKFAIKVTMENYPNTIQLGSVVNVDGDKLPKIDLLIGGSPCQSFSFAGKRKGMATKDEQEILTLDHYLQLKSEGYEFEGQSYLFWEYMRLLNETKPKYFLLENVMMGEKWEKVLSKAIGVNPIKINSSLVSAQNRERLYWTNIGMVPGGLFGDLTSIIEQPLDKKIFLKDILENDVDEKYFLSQKMVDGFMKHNENHSKKGTGFLFEPRDENKKGSCLRANASINATDNTIICHNLMTRGSTNGNGGSGHLSKNDGKTYCLDTNQSNAIEIVGAIKFGRTDEAKKIRKENMKNGKDHTPFSEKTIVNIDYDKMNTLVTSSSKDNLLSVEICAMRGRPNKDGKNIQKLEYRGDGKTNTLTSVNKDNLIKSNKKLGKTIEKNKTKLKDGDLLDCYNQTIHSDKSITVTTRINASNNTFIYKDELSAIMLGRSKNWGNPEKQDGKSYTLCKEQAHGVKNNSRIRRLTPLECERLQTVADGYTSCVSDSQRYKMLGNGWTVDVIAHIFKYIKNDK